MMSDCVPFWIIEDDEPNERSHCPGCGGFLPRNWPSYKQFECEKCGRTLEAFPVDDEDQDMEFSGKLCVVPDFAVKQKNQGEI